MKYVQSMVCTIVLLLVNIVFSTVSYAHVMVAQHGSLNIVDNGVFMVISLPVSAFKNIDNDNDGKLSAEEFTQHRSRIASTVHEKIILTDLNGKAALQGMMLAPVTSHNAPQAPASQLIIMGRYTIVSPNSELQYEVDLFGTIPSEKIIEVTVTNRQHNNKQIIKLSPKKTTASLFQSELLTLVKK